MGRGRGFLIQTTFPIRPTNIQDIDWKINADNAPYIFNYLISNQILTVIARLHDLFWITGGHTIDPFIKDPVPLTSSEPTTPFWNSAST